MSDDYGRILKYLSMKPDDPGAYEDGLAVIYDHIKRGDETFRAHNKEYRKMITGAMRRLSGGELAVMERLNEAYYRSLLIDAQVSFDAYCLYIEKNRDPRKRFYRPRRSRLLTVVNELQGLMDDKLDLLTISMPPGCGKALANDTLIITRNGWKRHGDLVVGDEVVGLDGKFKQVIAVHPKCMLDRKVTFANGEQIICHERHEWMVHNKHHPNTRYETLETKDIEKIGLEYNGTEKKRGHRYTFMLPDRPKVVGEYKELPLDPYTYGVWLGDGTNTEPRISSPLSDKAIIEKIFANGVKLKWQTQHKTTGVMYYGIDIRDNLQKMGMCYSGRRCQKYIAQAYLTASIEQRLELLAGLLDTDGTLSGNKYIYSTTEEALRDTFVRLVSTFGWRTCVRKYEPTISSFGIVGKRPYYTISFSPDMKIPCALERKRNSGTSKQRGISIRNIEKCEPVEGNCITVEGDGMYLAGRTMLPTHNTTLAIFLLTWIAGKWPDEPNLTGSHSNAFVHGVYDECLRILDPKGEYLWSDVFPGLGVTDTNAKDCRIDLGARKRFETLEFTSVGSGNAGLYRASRLLYCDDLVSGLEVALSRDRLDKLWETYTTDLRQRKIGDHCKELHIATRWSVNDVIGRLQNQYDGSDRARFIALPALDENDESNFDYQYGVGFSTAFYHEQRAIMDEVSWRALYMNEPIEREGLLYHQNELRRYFDLPDREPDAIISVCDTKDRGTDYCVMPIAYQYGQDYYIEDVVCDNGNPEVVEPRLVQKCVKHKVQMSRFESNSAGGRAAKSVQDEIKRQGGITKITTKYTTQNKETKIIMASPFVKEHFLFKDDSVTANDKEYRRFMNFLCAYTMTGKNKHDDVPDACSMLSDFVQTFAQSRVEVMARPW